MKSFRFCTVKTLAFLLAAILLAGALFCFASCGGEGTDPGTSGGTSDPADTSDTAESSAPDTTAAEVVLPTRDGWKFNDLPAYVGGEIKPGLLNCGHGLIESSTTCYMHTVNNTNLTEFEAYKSLLAEYGFVSEYEATVENNRFALFSNGKKRVYFYYTRFYKQVNIIRDPVSCPLDNFCYTLNPGTTEKTTLYAYGFNGTGQLILLHNSDGSWFINDGGVKTVDTEKLWQFMLSKTELAEGEKLRISLWYITHGHSDHFPGAAKMIETHHEQIALERVMWNFPEKSVIAPGSSQRNDQLAMQSMVNRLYPDVLYMKPHNGMKINVGDVELQFLYTQEDNIEKFLSKEYTDYNSSSAVCMLKFSGKSVFLPGDCKMGTIDKGGFMCNIYSKSTFGCDIMQVSHHGYNKINTLYNLLYPAMEYALFENTYAESVGKNSGSSAEVYNRLGAERCCFSDKTYAFTVIDGKIVRTEE